MGAQHEVKENSPTKNTASFDSKANTLKEKTQEVKTMKEETKSVKQRVNNFRTIFGCRSALIVLVLLASVVTVLGCLFFFPSLPYHGRVVMVGCLSAAIFLGLTLLVHN